MNELEYFVVSTHGNRCDIMRYMQQLRDLDEWIEYHLSHLRAIAAERVAYQKAQARKKQSGNCGGTRGRGGRDRGRGRASAAAESTLHAHHMHDVDASPQGEVGGNNGNADTVAGAYAAGLQRQFAWHETCVQRRCHEREAVAAELAERCSEVRLSMASRLANFAAVADVPVTELSG
ncbi:hypothetical protein conserved [Leishmania donovani]|uniref:Hypothetical_protein_conserved n=1 Tax=Leishmania donovani TaxID=5661 RepID=A0A504WYW9_LEIDO|nr:hypothetical protein CGC20_13650 [Leishmania donovani]CAJ1990231.1 hypothetical protein conserved [Leishmania donovani]VDZ46088.1 hypothetical_protein_conserved [Leishmania donovani]